MDCQEIRGTYGPPSPEEPPTKKGRVTVKHPDKDIPVKPSPALNDSLGYCSGNPDLLTYSNRRSFYETGRTLFLSRCL